MGVVKPVELLERSVTQSAAKPVSNPEGSETIETGLTIQGSRVGDSVPEAAGTLVR